MEPDSRVQRGVALRERPVMGGQVEQHEAHLLPCLRRAPAATHQAADLIEAAATLFQRLHEAEAQSRPRIAVAPVPTSGLGLAINDRLGRAAAPRSR